MLELARDDRDAARRGSAGGRPRTAARARVGTCASSGQLTGRCLAIVVARNEQEAVGDVLGGLPAEACGMPVDVLLVDDGSTDATPDDRPRSTAPGGDLARASRGLGAALRTGLERARDEGYAAAVYLDGDGEYDRGPARARARADRSRPRRLRARLALPRPPRGHDLAPRPRRTASTSALLGTLMRTVLSDGQTGYRAFSAPALRAARIRHDYNYAQVLTLSLWGAGIEPVEVPIDYRRRTSGRSFVRYPEYLARVAPALWREWRSSRRAEGRERQAISPASTYGQVLPVPNNGNSPVSGPNGARAAGHEPAVADAHVEVEPRRRGQRQRKSATPTRGACAGPRRRAGSRAAAPPADAGAGTRSRTSSGARKAATSSWAASAARAESRRSSMSRTPGHRAREAVAVRAPQQPQRRRRRAGRPAPSAAGRSRGRGSSATSR